VGLGQYPQVVLGDAERSRDLRAIGRVKFQ
jgi:hypothetical protein